MLVHTAPNRHKVIKIELILFIVNVFLDEETKPSGAERRASRDVHMTNVKKSSFIVYIKDNNIFPITYIFNAKGD